jgi:hypothetical protein
MQTSPADATTPRSSDASNEARALPAIEFVRNVIVRVVTQDGPSYLACLFGTRVEYLLAAVDEASWDTTYEVPRCKMIFPALRWLTELRRLRAADGTDSNFSDWAKDHIKKIPLGDEDDYILAASYIGYTEAETAIAAYVHERDLVCFPAPFEFPAPNFIPVITADGHPFQMDVCAFTTFSDPDLFADNSDEPVKLHRPEHTLAALTWLYALYQLQRKAGVGLDCIRTHPHSTFKQHARWCAEHTGTIPREDVWAYVAVADFMGYLDAVALLASYASHLVLEDTKQRLRRLFSTNYQLWGNVLGEYGAPAPKKARRE